MRAYKGFNRHEDGTLWCRDFQYEVGKTYKFEGKPALCVQGFHACHEPWQCWPFYPNNGENVYYEVECCGRIVESDTGDGKFVCTEIKLIKEIPTPKNKFDYCGNFSDGYAVVRLYSKYNYIDTEGNYLLEQWFDYCYYFKDGNAIVEANGKYNYINVEGNYLSEQWWDVSCDFNNGYAEVGLNDKCNWIGTDGQLLSKQWFDNCWDFKDGYAVVKLNNKFNYITTDWQLLSEQWFDDCYEFKYGYAKVILKDTWYIIDTNGKLTEL